MMEREELRLKEASEELDRLQLPNAQLDDAIMNGFLKGKRARNKRRKWKPWMYTGIAAAILFVGFVYLVNASPAFAAYVSKVPGLEGFVDIINADKSIKSAVENDYMEPIGISQEKDGIKVTLDAAIKDESGMVLFYTIEALRDIQGGSFELKDLADGKGESLLEGAAYSVGGPVHNLKKGEKLSRTLDFNFIDFTKVKQYNLKLHLYEQEFNFSFTLQKNAKKEVYDINRTVLVDGQSITVKAVTLYPLRADVHIEVDVERNSKVLYSFEDLRLVDGRGKIWGSAVGLIASGNNEDKHLYLQSSYFDRPEELYLEFNRIQAMDKGRAKIVIDTETGEILEAPDKRLSNLRVSGEEIKFDILAPEWSSRHRGMNIIGAVRDGAGKEIEVGTRFQEGDEVIGFSIPDMASIQNPITIEVGAYPSWIEEDIRIRVK